MNEDITQIIYNSLIQAGYTNEEARKCCNKKVAKQLYEITKKHAELITREWLARDYEFYKDLIINLD